MNIPTGKNPEYCRGSEEGTVSTHLGIRGFPVRTDTILYHCPIAASQITRTVICSLKQHTFVISQCGSSGSESLTSKVTDSSCLPRMFLALKREVPHPRKPLGSRQTMTNHHLTHRASIKVLTRATEVSSFGWAGPCLQAHPVVVTGTDSVPLELWVEGSH